MKHLRKFNESKVVGYESLPEKALEELNYYYGVDYKNKLDKIQVYEDPRVDGTFALRVYRNDDGYEFDLLWNKGVFDEVEFESFPPISGDLKFF